MERWLIECEASMRGTLQSVCKRAFAAYDSTPRIDWITQWPGQVSSGCLPACLDVLVLEAWPGALSVHHMS